MKSNMKIEKTVILNVDEKMIQVSTLPKEIQNEVETLDRMRQDYLDLAYQLEIIDLAIKGKMGQFKLMFDAEKSKSVTKQNTEIDAKNDV